MRFSLIFNFQIVVHGDRSYLDALIAVVPPETRCVAFSVDGSLTASVSVTGKDPRVRAGAVDVVRYWHERVKNFLLFGRSYFSHTYIFGVHEAFNLLKTHNILLPF